MPTQRRPVSRVRIRPRILALAGVLLFFAGVVSFMGIITAEALYPGQYSTGHNEISDLGATQPPDSVSKEPSATIFNTVMIVSGVLAIGGAVCVQRGFRRNLAAVFIGLFGLGALGVGVFPGNFGNVHALFAMLTFFAGGIAAVTTLTLATGPFRYISVLLGAVTLVVLLMYMITGDANPMKPLGDGGIERWVAYPIVVWAIGFGGHLMGRAR